MTNFAPTNATKVLAVTAVLAAILFTVGHADAGSQMPYWKKMQLQNQYNAMMNPGTPGNDDKIVVIDEVIPQDNPDNGYNGQTGGDDWPGDMGNGGGNGQGPKAVPTPSAVLGGIAMLGLIAGRRNRKNQDD